METSGILTSVFITTQLGVTLTAVKSETKILVTLPKIIDKTVP